MSERTDGSGLHAQVLRKAWTRLEQEDAEEGSSADAQSAVDVAAADPAAELARKAMRCALAKLHVELDRNEQAREVGVHRNIIAQRRYCLALSCLLDRRHLRLCAWVAHPVLSLAVQVGYGTAIMRMVNAHSMAKGDLLVGVPCEVQQWRPLHHLLQTPTGLDTA